MERPRTLNPAECKQAIRHISSTDNPHHHAFDYSSSFTFLDGIQN